KGQQRNQLAVAASHGCPGELTLLLLLSLLGSGRADFASDRAECGNQVIGLATCLAYVQGHAEDPSPDCCSGLKQVVAKSFRCLCVLIKDRNEPNLSFRFNFTRALLLSPKCDVTANLSDCPRLLNLAPNSAEAKFFEQFGMDIKATAAGAGAGNSTGNASPTENKNGGRDKTLSNASDGESNKSWSRLSTGGEQVMEMKTVSCFILLFVTLAHVDARLGFDPTLMDQGVSASGKNMNHLLYSDRNAHYQFHTIKDDYIMPKFYHEAVLYTMISTGNMDSYMEEQPQESACGSCLEASQRAKKALDDLETFGELQRLCLPLPSGIKDKCLERSSAYIRQTKLSLRDLFDQENLCKSTGQCTGESMSPRKDAITPLMTESAKKVEECGECNEAVKQIFAGLQTPRMIKKMKQILGEYCEEVESEKHCEVILHRYVPIIMLQLEKLKPEEMCGTLGFCAVGMPL
ncbi:Protease inhibitor/seed storage/LTP family, partial [Musa troglodytarum]